MRPAGHDGTFYAQTEFLNASAAPGPGVFAASFRLVRTGFYPPQDSNRQTVIRPRVDPPQQRRAACVIRRPVEGVEGRFKQRIRDIDGSVAKNNGESRLPG